MRQLLVRDARVVLLGVVSAHVSLGWIDVPCRSRSEPDPREVPRVALAHLDDVCARFGCVDVLGP